MIPFIFAASAAIEIEHYSIPPQKDAIFICAKLDQNGRIVGIWDVLQWSSDIAERDELRKIVMEPSFQVPGPVPQVDGQIPVRVTLQGAQIVTGHVCHLQPLP